MRKKEQVDPPLFLWRAMEEPYRALISFFFKISAFTTAVRYSRVGLGNSRYDHKNKDFDTMVSELEALINALNISQSFLLVGHSYGGLIIRS